MNKLKILAVLLCSGLAGAALGADEVPGAVPAEGAEAQAAPALVALDRIAAIVNNDVITEYELSQRVHTVAINLRRQNIQLPPMENLRSQVLERLISERTIMQRARQTGIRIDDQMVNASIEQIAAQNNLTLEELRQRLLADGVSFEAFREQIRDEITTHRLREREVDSKITILDSEIDAYLAEKAGFTGNSTTEYRIEHILLPFASAQEESDADRTARSLADRAREGEDFFKLVTAYSRSPDALTGGDLGWQSAADIPEEFWDAIKENIRVGNIYVTHSKSAVHVLKLAGERNGVEAKLAGGPVEQTHVRHILMIVSDITPEADVIRRLSDIKARILRGETDFASMARLNSVDNSATRGGDLGWVQHGDTVEQFDEAMRRLAPGEISDPVKTNYGYHLIQVIDRRTDTEGNPQRMRVAARQALRQKKQAEATYNWQRELRDEAYVDIRDQDLQ